jgi:hypothetical protein
MKLKVSIAQKTIKPGKTTGLNYRRVMKKNTVWFIIRIKSNEKSVNSL